MESKTSDAVKYTIEIGLGTFTFIDTPGFGDTRGIWFDKAQGEKIRESILREGGINCVCVV
jgi:hypothetical protein